MSFRGKDLAEAPVDQVAHDNHSLASGPEGPEEPDKPDDLFHNLCMFMVSATPSDKWHSLKDCHFMFV